MRDYRRDVIDELRCIDQLRVANKVCLDRLKELDSELTRTKTPVPQTTPVQGGGNRTEERWLNIMSIKTDEEKRLRSVRRRLKRFNTAWETLTERDRIVLQEWYINGSKNSTENITNREGCDRSTAFRWRDEALIRFARAFYGAVVD